MLAVAFGYGRIVLTLLAAAALSVPVTVHNAPCPANPAWNGCYYAETNEAYVAPHADRFTRLHEIGHALFAQMLDDGERYAFSCLPAMRPADGDPPRCGRWNSDVNELAADVYANCALGWKPDGPRFANRFGYNATRRQHRNACRFINRAAD